MTISRKQQPLKMFYVFKYMYLNWAETEEMVTVYSIYYYVGPTEGLRTKPRGTPVLLSKMISYC